MGSVPTNIMNNLGELREVFDDFQTIGPDRLGFCLGILV